MASIRKRVRKDGTPSWQVLWRSEEGVQSSVTFLTEPEARTLRAALNANGGSLDKAQKVLLPETTQTHTLAEVARQHIDMLTKPTPGTLDVYEGYLKNHIMDSIGGVPVEALTMPQIQAWVKGLMRKPTGSGGRTMAPKTVHNVYKFLSSVLTTATVLKYRPDNPAHRVNLPSLDERDEELMFFTAAEFTLIRDNMDERYRTFITFLVMTGLRFGEATAITPNDVNLDASPANIRVSKAWKYGKARGGFYVGPPKSKSSKRTVSIPQSLVDLLRPAMVGVSKSSLLFTTPDGGRIPNQWFYGSVWLPALKGAKAADATFDKDVKPHVLRHTHATWLIQSGVELFKVAKRLGHSGTGMVEKVYGHLMPEAQIESATAIGRAMLGGMPELETLDGASEKP